jgi:hypothetical protein
MIKIPSTCSVTTYNRYIAFEKAGNGLTDPRKNTYVCMSAGNLMPERAFLQIQNTYLRMLLVELSERWLAH